MSDLKLDRVLALCQEVASENKTDNLLSGMDALLRKEFKRIQEEASVERSSKRRVYGVIEAKLIDYFMQLCKFSCSKTNISVVHEIMTTLGYKGYHENEKRFRQRTENVLKKMKKHGKKKSARGAKNHAAKKNAAPKVSRPARAKESSVHSPCLGLSQGEAMDHVSLFNSPAMNGPFYPSTVGEECDEAFAWRDEGSFPLYPSYYQSDSFMSSPSYESFGYSDGVMYSQTSDGADLGERRYYDHDLDSCFTDSLDLL